MSKKNQENQKDEQKVGITIVKIPKGMATFLQKNPKLSEVVGRMLIKYNENKTSLEKILKVNDTAFKEVLEETSEFEKDLESGTIEELKEFLNSVYENRDQMFSTEDVTLEEKEKITKALKENCVGYVETEIKTEETEKEVEEKV